MHNLAFPYLGISEPVVSVLHLHRCIRSNIKLRICLGKKIKQANAIFQLMIEF